MLLDFTFAFCRRVGPNRLGECLHVARDLERNDGPRGIGKNHEAEAVIVPEMLENHRRCRFGVFERSAGHRAAVVDDEAEGKRRLSGGRLLFRFEHEGEMNHFRASAEHCFVIEMAICFQNPRILSSRVRHPQSYIKTTCSGDRGSPQPP